MKNALIKKASWLLIAGGFLTAGLCLLKDMAEDVPSGIKEEDKELTYVI